MDDVSLKSKTASYVSAGSRSVLRSLTVGSLLLRKQLWVWPILAAVLLGIVGRWISRSVETAMRERRVSELTTVLNADVAALRVWMNEQAIDAEFIASDERILPAVDELLKAAGDKADSERGSVFSPGQAALRSTRATAQPLWLPRILSGFSRGRRSGRRSRCPRGENVTRLSEGVFRQRSLPDSRPSQSLFPAWSYCPMRRGN